MTDLELPEQFTGGIRAYLGAVVWPVYLGVSSCHPGMGTLPLGEPYGEPDYERGQIIWTRINGGDITGTARIYIPKGIWTHLVFCFGFHRDAMLGSTQVDHPLVFDAPGILDVDPIHNQDAMGMR